RVLRGQRLAHGGVPAAVGGVGLPLPRRPQPADSGVGAGPCQRQAGAAAAVRLAGLPRLAPAGGTDRPGRLDRRLPTGPDLALFVPASARRRRAGGLRRPCSVLPPTRPARLPVRPASRAPVTCCCTAMNNSAEGAPQSGAFVGCESRGADGPGGPPPAEASTYREKENGMRTLVVSVFAGCLCLGLTGGARAQDDLQAIITKALK